VTDSNLQNCPSILTFNSSFNKCVEKYNFECSLPEDAEGSFFYVIYKTGGKQNGKNVECTFPLDELVPGNYIGRIVTYQQINNDLYKIYYSKSLTGKIVKITIP